MSSNNPRTLITSLEDLNQESWRWQVNSQETLTQMEWHQTQTEEQLEQRFHHARIVSDQAQSDNERVADARARVNQTIAESDQVLHRVRGVRQQTKETLRRAEATLAHWQSELVEARCWLESAEARLALAIQKRKEAWHQLSAARSKLDNARYALKQCQSSFSYDSKGNLVVPSCDYEQDEVSRAEKKVQLAKEVFRKAQQEEKAATIEVENAKLRISCCESAVGYGKRGLSIAQRSFQRAEHAVAQAERSLEYAEAADRDVHRAEDAAMAEQDAADAMMGAVLEAELQTRDAATYFQSGRLHGESGQQLIYLMTREIDQRIAALIELNHSGDM